MKECKARLSRQLQNFAMSKDVKILKVPYDKKTVFSSVNYFGSLQGEILIQAHQSVNSIILSVSIQKSDTLFQDLDREVIHPGLLYIETKKQVGQIQMLYCGQFWKKQKVYCILRILTCRKVVLSLF